MARPLAEGLRTRVVVQDHTAEQLMPQHLSGVRESIRVALEVEARSDVETTWSAAGPVTGDSGRAENVFVDSREALLQARPHQVFDILTRLGGRQGWFRCKQLWRLRGLLDRLAGGRDSTARHRAVVTEELRRALREWAAY